MSQIDLQGVTRSYSGQVVLANLDLTVEAGEFVAIAGPSGTGKSTLLNLLGGLDRPDGGRVVVAGVDLATAPEAALDAHRRDRVGFIFQSFHINPRRTALENVLLPLVFAPLEEDEDRVGRARLREVGLEALADRPAATLSGGQRQRVAVARALIRKPPILLADEPVGDLDAATGAEIVALLEGINREQGVTIVSVTHDVALLRAASRRLGLEQGRLVPLPDEATR
ncbi:MAG: ABC transporter ATP-binding protein [Armatimonadetes bacterium]|nr:ABC transporter ATP-binding protein [Armatimonadota bacterium]